jgi:HK97 family phage prohead protease
MVVNRFIEDRDHDRVNPRGADLSAFSRNGPLLWAHRHSDLPIGRVTAVWVDANDNLRAKWRWLENDEFASRVRNAWDQNVVNAASIGFLPVTKSVNSFGGFDYHTWQLLEISLCSVPSNPAAVRTLKSLGLYDDGPRYKSEEEIPDAWANSALQAIRDSVAEVQSRRGDLDITNAELQRRLRQDGPRLVREAMNDVLIEETARAARRLRGCID